MQLPGAGLGRAERQEAATKAGGGQGRERGRGWWHTFGATSAGAHSQRRGPSMEQAGVMDELHSGSGKRAPRMLLLTSHRILAKLFAPVLRLPGSIHYCHWMHTSSVVRSVPSLPPSPRCVHKCVSTIRRCPSSAVEPSLLDTSVRGCFGASVAVHQASISRRSTATNSVFGGVGDHMCMEKATDPTAAFRIKQPSASAYNKAGLGRREGIQWRREEGKEGEGRRGGMIAL